MDTYEKIDLLNEAAMKLFRQGRLPVSSDLQEETGDQVSLVPECSEYRQGWIAYTFDSARNPKCSDDKSDFYKAGFTQARIAHESDI